MIDDDCFDLGIKLIDCTVDCPFESPFEMYQQIFKYNYVNQNLFEDFEDA